MARLTRSQACRPRPVEFGLDRQRPGIRRQPAGIGEHNAEVLGEAGFTAAEVAGLAEAGVIAARTDWQPCRLIREARPRRDGPAAALLVNDPQ
jgi:hypothetical protein